MVGFGVAGYTGIIEQGVEQQQGAMPMTTTQNDATPMSDGQLDTVAAGAVFIKIDGMEKATPKYRHLPQFAIDCDYSDGFKVRCPDDRNH